MRPRWQRFVPSASLIGRSSATRSTHLCRPESRNWRWSRRRLRWKPSARAWTTTARPEPRLGTSYRRAVRTFWGRSSPQLRSWATTRPSYTSPTAWWESRRTKFSRVLAEEPEGLLLLVHRSSAEHAGLGPATERLLGVTEFSGSRSRLSVAGVCAFGPGLLRRASTAPAAPDSRFDLIAVAEWLASLGHKPQVGFVQSWRRYRGDSLDLLELNRLVLDQYAPEGDAIDTGDNRIEGRVSIHPTAELKSSIIVGPTIIGPGARISNSFVGPYTSIGARAEIEGAEVERSIIADGARIMHVSRRIEGSTIGQRATIFRDFALPRGIRLHVGANAEMAFS